MVSSSCYVTSLLAVSLRHTRTTSTTTTTDIRTTLVEKHHPAILPTHPHPQPHPRLRVSSVCPGSGWPLAWRKSNVDGRRDRETSDHRARGDPCHATCMGMYWVRACVSVCLFVSVCALVSVCVRACLRKTLFYMILTSGQHTYTTLYMV